MSRKSTTLEFIEKAKLVHGNKYDYSLTEYTLSKNKVKIICPIHGVFEQISNTHLSGKGCIKCGNELCSKRLSSSKDEFIKKARKIHGDKYDYSEAIYDKSDKKLTIICPIHGTFEQTPSGHLSGRGCSECANHCLVSTNKFIKRAKLIHGDRYDYSNTVCCGSEKKVEIICKKHGSFWQLQYNHLKGYNCKECSLYDKKPKVSQCDFINKAKKIHGDKYIYDKVVYVLAREKVIITCRKHGDFLQTPDNHYRNGCPKCAGYYEEKYALRNIPLYETHYKGLTFIGIECRRNTNDKNILEVKCHLCKEWFIPANNEAHRSRYTGNDLYCSEHCKSMCPVFGFHSSSIDPRSKLYIEKTETKKARACQTNVIKQLQCQSDGKLHCERCGNEIHSMDAELHHTYEIHKHGMNASDHESQMLVCIKCHLELHNNCK